MWTIDRGQQDLGRVESSSSSSALAKMARHSCGMLSQAHRREKQLLSPLSSCTKSTRRACQKKTRLVPLFWRNDQYRSRFVFGIEGDLFLITHGMERGETNSLMAFFRVRSSSNTVTCASNMIVVVGHLSAVAASWFFRAPSSIKTMTCAFNTFVIGCRAGEVLHLRAQFVAPS